MPALLGGNLATVAKLNNMVKEDVLEGEEESSRQDALGDLGDDALVEASVALLVDDAI